MDFWSYVFFIVALFVSFAIGTFGFAQIIGSLRTVATRGGKLTFFTVTLWTLILAVVAFLVFRFLPSVKIALLIGYAISFLIMLFQRNVE